MGDVSKRSAELKEDKAYLKELEKIENAYLHETPTLP